MMHPARCLLIVFAALGGCTSTPEPQPTPTASLVGTWTFQKRSSVVWTGGTPTTQADMQPAGAYATTFNTDGTFVSVTSPTYGSWTVRGTYTHMGNTLTTRVNTSTGTEIIVKLTDHDLITEQESTSGGIRTVMTEEYTR
ncbi:hypothetical protein ACFP2F_21590 [Hymenobacter artigasi]|uniref:Lipocalin-like domain-containing protein n=1 Tax=Hymenobacter artigasi TaxID=2719616 RepID=A0ABX1HNM8_9BACT|nr:hypothetical protein [Hymenobacter artigasi]NKI91864.1 hypothetical protein [Hymenobacter artigasi]